MIIKNKNTHGRKTYSGSSGLNMLEWICLTVSVRTNCVYAVCNKHRVKIRKIGKKNCRDQICFGDDFKWSFYH